MNLYLVVVGMTGLFLNIFPWIVCYSKLRAQSHRSSRDVLLISLVLVDFLTVCVPLPVYLSKHYNCPRNQRTSFVGRPTICEIFHLMFVWLKLAALFIITTLNYTSYLAITARGIYRSIGDRISSSLACSKYELTYQEKTHSTMVIANLVIGIAIVAFFDRFFTIHWPWSTEPFTTIYPIISTKLYENFVSVFFGSNKLPAKEQRAALLVRVIHWQKRAHRELLPLTNEGSERKETLPNLSACWA